MSYLGPNDYSNPDFISGAIVFLTKLLHHQQTYVVLYVRDHSGRNYTTFTATPIVGSEEQEPAVMTSSPVGKRSKKSINKDYDEEEEEDLSSQRVSHARKMSSEGPTTTYGKTHTRAQHMVKLSIKDHSEKTKGIIVIPIVEYITAGEAATRMIEECITYEKNSIHITTPGRSFEDVIRPFISGPHTATNIQRYLRLFKDPLAYPQDNMFSLKMKPRSWENRYEVGMIAKKL